MNRGNRRSIRLRGYDYSRAGAYFVTICTQNRDCLFGDIVDGKMVLNDAGRMNEKWYMELENKFSGTHCDEYAIMPNHVHFVIINVGADLCVCPGVMRVAPDSMRVCPDSMCVCPDSMCVDPDDDGRLHGQTHRIAPTTGTGVPQTGAHTGAPLPEIVQWFKTMTTNAYIRGVKQHGWPRFDRRLWQRNYWEHIIRNENELHRIRQYIVDNPGQWESDHNNPRVGADLCVRPDGGQSHRPTRKSDKIWRMIHE